MFSFFDIIRRDAATYYDGEPSRRVSRVRVLIGFTMFALGIGLLVGTASSNFLAGALSAQAILVGFSFNVLFYLVANRLTKPAAFSGLEHELRFERLSTLSDEVFDNVTYFSLISICSIVAALALLLGGSQDFEKNLHHIAVIITYRTTIDGSILSWMKWLGSTISLSILIFLLTESIYTFLRAVGRVRFYFGMLRSMNADA